MATTNIVRVTKAQKYEGIMALLNGGSPVIIEGKDDKEGVTMDAAYLCDFCKGEMELLARKNTSDKKPTATQAANEGHKALIMEFLSAQTEGVTCTDVQKGVPEFSGFNNQKIAALMRQLVEAGKVTKSVVKGKSMFAMA